MLFQKPTTMKYNFFVKYIFAALLANCIAFGLSAQRDTLDNGITLSLITGSPGTELYSVFGHSAIRVRNVHTRQDILYNYGTFDFNTPNFYWKFLRGKLPYMLSIDRTDDLARYYQLENRSLTEQLFDLTLQQEVALLAYLEWNYQPDNRYYLYDFFYDNCATIIRDVLEQQFNLQYNNDTATRDITFRQLLDEYLQDMPWSDFGIDLVLGLPADKKANFRNQMFLPDYLSSNLAQATLDGKPLLQPAQLIQPRADLAAPPHRFTPMLLFVLLALLAVAITFSKNRRAKDIFDLVTLSICGIAGLFLTFMWLGTDHIATKWNWNVLWLNPLCLVLVAGILRRADWARWAFAIYATILWLLLLTWGWFPQQFNTAIIPILISLIARSMDREGVVFGIIFAKFNRHSNIANAKP